MSEEDKEKDIENKIDENQSESDSNPLDNQSKEDSNSPEEKKEEIQLLDENNTQENQNIDAQEEQSTGTSSDNIKMKREHEVIHKKDGRLHIYVRQDKYKGELKSKNWVGRLYFEGKQKISSSGTPNLEEAIPILEKWFDDILQTKEKKNKLPKKL
tara:strand:- start:452 stop:919 length:468 start_codon:yes stop_codon:yes gene_type:complete